VKHGAPLAGADGRTLFVKAADADVLAELAVYEAVGDASFLPRMVASAREPVPLLASPGHHDRW
jgi:hypothetical protein